MEVLELDKLKYKKSTIDKDMKKHRESALHMIGFNEGIERVKEYLKKHDPF